MTKTDEKALKRQKSYDERQRAKGFVRIHPWIHKSKRQQLLDHAEKLNSEHGQSANRGR